MWTNPKYPELAQARQPKPPTDDGEPLLVVPRGDREELRVVLKTFEGHPYVSLRIWEKDQAGEFRPVRGKGVSVRISEAAGVAEALKGLGVKVVAGTGGDQRLDGSSRPAQRRGRPQPKRDGGEQARLTDPGEHREPRIGGCPWEVGQSIMANTRPWPIAPPR